jgi:hypothetical protein
MAIMIKSTINSGAGIYSTTNLGAERGRLLLGWMGGKDCFCTKKNIADDKQHQRETPTMEMI